MTKEKLQQILIQIDSFLAASGIPADQITEFREELMIKQKDKDRKLLASEIATELAKIIKIPSNEPIIEAIKGIKQEAPIVNVPEPKVIVREARQPEIKVSPPKVIVNPPKIEVKPVVKAQEPNGLFKKLLEALKKKPEPVTTGKPMPVKLIHEGEEYRAQIVGGGGPSRIWLKNKDNQVVSPLGEVVTPTTYNVRIDNASVEHSQVIPEGTKKIRVYLMDGNKRYPFRETLKLSWNEGESGGTPISIPALGVYQEDGVNLKSKTLYFQVATATSSPYVIISCWT